MATLYFNSTASGDDDFGNVSNWWLNVGATVPAGVIPTAFDDIIVQTPLFASPEAQSIGVNTAVFNNNTYLYGYSYINYSLTANLATFNGNSYIDQYSGISSASDPPYQAGNAVFNNTACIKGGYVQGTAKFNYLTATTSGGAYQITDITGYGVGYAQGGAYDSNDHFIGIVNFVNTDSQSDGVLSTAIINFYNSTVNYGTIVGNATFYDYSQNFGYLGNIPTIVYPNPNVFVQGTYNASTNTGAIYYGYGVYFNNYISGTGDADFGNANNWYIDGITQLGYVPISTMDASLFDCPILTDSSGSASLEIFYLYGNTYSSITISASVDFSNNSHNNGTINGYGQFNDNSYNGGIIDNISSFVSTFNNSSYNSGTVTGTSAFYGNTYNSGYVGTSGGTTASFHDASQNRGVIGGTLTTGSLAYWNLNDDGSGGVSLVDSTGNGYTLTNQDGVTLGSGIIGGGAVFTDAIGDQSLYNNSVLGVGNGAASTSFWINPTTYGTGGFSDYAGAPFSYNYDTSSGWLFIFNTDGNLRLFNGNLAYQSIAVIPLNAWTHICVTRDESSNVNFYINGSLDGSFTESSYINTTYSIFGRPIDQSSGVLHYNGIVDETGIWNRALSQTEVTALYNGGAGRTYPFTGSTPSAISNGDFNDTSINIGLITGSARFRYVTATSGVVVDVTGYANGPVNGLTYDSANNVITTWRFQGTHFMLSGATITGNAQFVQNTGASGIPVCLITGNAVVTSPAQRPLQATVLGSITYVGYGGSSSVNIFVMLNFPFPINYILGKTNPFGISALLKLPFYINK